MRKIGIVYAISHAAGEYCKNQIEKNGYPSSEIIIHECPANNYKMASNDLSKISNLIIQSIDNLAKRGASIIIIAANSVHQAFDLVNEYVKSTYPKIELLSIVNAAVNDVLLHNYKTVSIFGSNSTINSNIYHKQLQKAEINTLLLTNEEQSIVNSLISMGVSPDAVNIQMKENIMAIAESLKRRGCDAIILACTELPLIFNADNLNIPVIDTSSSLGLAALQKANFG